MGFNLTCNTTLEEMRILEGSERAIVGSLTFHQLALIIAGVCAIVAILLSFYLIWMHALHYTKPWEQRHIIRILFMVPVYAASAFLQLWYYYHAVYFQVISDCYEAFAISSFFALMCHYIAPDLHEQKNFFRYMRPIKPWVWPVNWFRACCCGERGPWRTPKSGLTWFNIIWIGIYHYCFIRVAMTITAVVTQYFGRYCESSNSPVFSHIWVVSIECLAVTIAMYCIIQFYVQLREPLAEHRPFLKVLAIKLVIFLAFWQTVAISVGTSDRVNLVKPNHVIAYPDIKVGIPALLLCFEMACFAVLHLWAYPYRPYLDGAPKTFYPVPDPDSGLMPRENEHGPREGGFLGLLAIIDAVNIWDVVKAFGRGIRWLFVGVKRRKEDVSYQPAAGYRNRGLDEDVDSLAKKHAATDTSYPMQTYGAAYDSAAASGGPMTATLKRKKTAEYLPIAHEFRRSRFGLPAVPGDPFPQPADERVGLISHAQPNPDSTGRMSAASNSPTATTNTTMTSPHGHYQEQHLAAPLSPESTLASPSYRAVSPYTDGDQRYRIREAPSDATGIASGSRRDTRYDTGGDKSQAGMARVREDDDWEEIGVNSGHQHQPQQQHAQGGTGRGGQRQQQRQNPQQYYERRGYR